MNTHGVIFGKRPVHFSHFLAHILHIIIFLTIASFCTPQDGFSDDPSCIIKVAVAHLGESAQS